MKSVDVKYKYTSCCNDCIVKRPDDATTACYSGWRDVGQLSSVVHGHSYPTVEGCHILLQYSGLHKRHCKSIEEIHLTQLLLLYDEKSYHIIQLY